MSRTRAAPPPSESGNVQCPAAGRLRTLKPQRHDLQVVLKRTKDMSTNSSNNKFQKRLQLDVGRGVITVASCEESNQLTIDEFDFVAAVINREIETRGL